MKFVIMAINYFSTIFPPQSVFLFFINVWDEHYYPKGIISANEQRLNAKLEISQSALYSWVCNEHDPEDRRGHVSHKASSSLALGWDRSVHHQSS